MTPELKALQFGKELVEYLRQGNYLASLDKCLVSLKKLIDNGLLTFEQINSSQEDIDELAKQHDISFAKALIVELKKDTYQLGMIDCAKYLIWIISKKRFSFEDIGIDQQKLDTLVARQPIKEARCYFKEIKNCKFGMFGINVAILRNFIKEGDVSFEDFGTTEAEFEKIVIDRYISVAQNTIERLKNGLNIDEEQVDRVLERAGLTIANFGMTREHLVLLVHLNNVADTRKSIAKMRGGDYEDIEYLYAEYVSQQIELGVYTFDEICSDADELESLGLQHHRYWAVYWLNTIRNEGAETQPEYIDHVRDQTEFANLTLSDIGTDEAELADLAEQVALMPTDLY